MLETPEFHDTLDDVDRRALSPLFWTHINPYGRIHLDMDSRLDLSIGPDATEHGSTGIGAETGASVTR